MSVDRLTGSDVTGEPIDVNALDDLVLEIDPAGGWQPGRLHIVALRGEGAPYVAWLADDGLTLQLARFAGGPLPRVRAAIRDEAQLVGLVTGCWERTGAA